MQVGFETSSRLLLLCRRVVVPAQFALTEYHIIGVPLVCGDRVHPQYSTELYLQLIRFVGILKNLVALAMELCVPFYATVRTTG